MSIKTNRLIFKEVGLDPDDKRTLAEIFNINKNIDFEFVAKFGGEEEEDENQN